MYGFAKSRCLFLAASLGIAFASQAQEAPVLGELAALGEDYANLISFSAEPRIAAAGFSIDSGSSDNASNDVRAIKVPLYREFDVAGSDMRWFAEGTFSYTLYQQKLAVTADDVVAFRATSRWSAVSGMLQAGLVIPLGAGFSLTPTLGAGASRLDNETSFSDPFFEERLRPAFDGVLFNWASSATIGKADIGVRYKNEFGDWGLRGKAHLIYSYVDSFNESSRFQAFSNGSATFSATLDLKHPLSWTFRDEALYLIGTFSNVTFLGNNRSSLGFGELYEAGLSIGYRRYAIGLLGVFGQDVNGLSLTFDYGY